MASRILTCVSCTLYLFLLISFTIIGFASLIVGAIGVGLYIPTSQTYNNYNNNTCFIVDVKYDACIDSCYYITWSVEYHATRRYSFSTITQTYETLNEVSEQIAIYSDKSNHTCYYDLTQITRVQWTRPPSPTPYLIMLIIGFSLTGIYLILIAFFHCYRLYNSNK